MSIAGKSQPHQFNRVSVETHEGSQHRDCSRGIAIASGALGAAIALIGAAVASIHIVVGSVILMAGWAFLTAANVRNR